MGTAIVLLLLAGLVGLALLVYGLRDISKASEWAKLLQALFTVGAFSLAAYWYFVERKGMPHADVGQRLEVISLDNGLVAVEAHVTIENIGARLLRVERINSRLQTIEPERFRYRALARLGGDQYWKARRPGGRNAQFADAELRWPVLRQFDSAVVHEIEPGETDLFVATFLISCDEASHIRVATDIYKPGTDGDFAWKARSFANLREVCSDNPEGDAP